MNSGIYALYWWEQDLVYIGSSQNLNRRHREHIQSLTYNTHINYKVQNTYNLYGEPDFIVLEHCLILELPEKEIQWCTEFNALSPRGLCLTYPYISNTNVNIRNQKYQTIQILKAFSLLYKGEKSVSEIQARTKITTNTISSIQQGFCHIWLSEKYPAQYQQMLSIDRRNLGKRNYTQNMSTKGTITDNKGNIFIVNNITEFCKKVLKIPEDQLHAVCCGIRRVLNKRQKQYKGYTLV